MARRPLFTFLIAAAAIIVAAVALWAYQWIRGGHHYWVSAAAFNSDGTLLATAGGDDHLAEIILWDLVDARKISSQTIQSGRPRWIRFAGEPRHVFLSCDIVGKDWDDFHPNEVMRVDLAAKRMEDSFVEPDVLGGTLALEGTPRLITYGRKTIELREPAEGRVTRLPVDGSAEINDLAVSADERHLAAACDGVARVWNLETRTEAEPLEARGADLGAIAIANGGDLVAASIDDLGSNAEVFPLFFWDRSGGTAVVETVQFTQPVTELRYLAGSPPQLLVISGKDHLDCQVAIYDASGKQLHELYAGNAAITSLDISRDGSLLVWVDSRGNGQLWRIDGPQPARLWQTKLGELRLVRFSPDTRLFVGHPFGPDVTLFDATTGNVATRLAGYQQSSLSFQLLAFLPMVLLVAGISWYSSLRAKRRLESMLAVARQLGWPHTSGSLPAGIPEFRFFAKRRGGRFEHVLLGAGDQYDTLLAVYRWVEGSGDKRTPVHELCAIYPHVCNGLPDVFIRPESFADKLAEYVGFADVDLDGSDTLERFSSRYLLRTKSPEGMRDLVNEPLAEFLCDHEGWHLEIVDGSVLMWWKVVKSFSTNRFPVTESSGVIAFLEESRTILQLLLPEIGEPRR